MAARALFLVKTSFLQYGRKALVLNLLPTYDFVILEKEAVDYIS